MKPTPEQETRAAQTIAAKQATIFDYLQTLPQRTDEEDDTPRLDAQCVRVYRALRDLAPHTLAELSAATGDPEGSVSARIREVRRYLEDRTAKGQTMPGPAAKGTVLKERVPGGNGLHTYSMRLKKYSGAA